MTLTGLVACSVLFWGLSAAAQRQGLRTVEQSYQAVQLTAWREAGELGFRDQDGNSFSVPQHQIVRYGMGRTSRTGQGVLLIDGSMLTGRISSIDSQECQLVASYFRVSIPKPLIRSVLVHAPGDAGIEQQWLATAEQVTGTDDRIQTTNDDWVLGTVQSNPSGAIYRAGESDPLRVKGNDSQPQNVAWQQVRGIIFSPLLTKMLPAPKDALIIGLRDGSRLITTRVTGSDDGVWQFRLACGVELSTRANQFSAEHISYIGNPSPSDGASLPPVSLFDHVLRIRQTPLIGNPVDASLNQAGVAERVVPVGDRWAQSGLRLTVGSQAVFRVPSGAKRIAMDLLADFRQATKLSPDEIRPIACVISVVKAGGKVEEVWRADGVRAMDNLLSVEFPCEQSAAVIISIERTTVLQPSPDAVLLNPLVHF